MPELGSREDDKSIQDSDRLLRRVPPSQLIAGEDGKHRPSSALFKTEQLSINIESLMIEQGRPLESALDSYPREFLTSIRAGQVREFGYPIVKDTEPPNDPAHGLVLGKKTDRFAKTMVRSHQWIVPPP